MFQAGSVVKEGKAIPVTGHGRPTLWFPHFLDHLITESVEAVSLVRLSAVQLPFNSSKSFSIIPIQK
jgi:hypothetical protein